ncbi:MAG TPA: ammonia-forming cytochrome c nitrite reductase subunit c552 [Kofleriaceae bacterium]|nr:ammonia-forming cytochrome c nitrite reductase subunit c552 [Kofleriaceae bacterium]
MPAAVREAMFGVLAVIAACGGGAERPERTERAERAERDSPPPAAAANESNILRADYIGPDGCAECHPDKHAAWQRSLHAVMNQRAQGDAVAGAWNGASVAYGGRTARFLREDGVAIMDLAGTRYRVTRTIGARALQEYVGVREGDATGLEVRLPFGWWIARAGWYPQPYFDSWFGAERDATGALAFDPYAPEPTPWATRCAWCHNTYPFELRLLRDPAIGNGPEGHVALVSTTRSPEARAAIREQNLLPTGELVTVGISCESCHLGGRAHADGAPQRFAPVGPHVRRKPDAPPLARGRDEPALVNAICAQCHSTPSPRYPDGAATRNSTEALDLAAGACASAIACTDCHDPHRRGPGAGAPAQPAQLAACTLCHQSLAGDTAALAHARHPAGAASCLDCHMPRIVEGIGGFVRSHRISSPTDPAMLAAGAPNACNLCHLDRSIRWTTDALRTGWGAAVAPQPSWRAAYGELENAVGLAWLTSRHAPVRLAAAAAYARRGQRADLPALVELLDAPVAHDRMWMLLAIEQLLGRRLARDEYDPIAEPAVRARQAAALRRTVAEARP